MDTVRVTAKTVADALTEASIQLGTSSDNIEYTVIDEGSKGFLGLGGRKAVIEAKKKVSDEELMKEIFEDKPEKPKKESKKEYKKDNNSKKENKKENKKEYKTEKKENKEQKKEAKKEPEKVKESNNADAPAEAKAKPKKEFEAKSEKEFNSKKETDPKKEFEGKKGSDPEKENTEPRAPRVPADPEVAKSRAVDFIKEILKAMEIEAGVTAEFEEDTLCVNIDGEDMGVLIGKRGQTLDSLQYLTSLVVNKGKASYVRVKLDTEDYRARRKATLENLARNIASKVKKTRRPVFLEPMNPYERRIIHSALQNDPYVTTHSEGEEPFRKVVVTPKKDRDRNYGGGYSSRYNSNGGRRGRYNRGGYNSSSYDIEAAQSEFAQAEDQNEGGAE